jgi:P4 family phage/plasmid primase-like protien
MDEKNELEELISKYKVSKGSTFTHTSIGSPKVSLNITDDKVLDRFYTLIQRSVSDDIEQYFVEKPLNPSPLRVDLDFRFACKMNDEGEVIMDRNVYYTRKNLRNIVNGYFEILNDMFDFREDTIHCFVTEKPNPVKDKNMIKDGVHLVFPDVILEHALHHYVRESILDKANVVFSGIYLENEYKNVVDKAIIDSNCWQIYGCQKPSSQKYRLTAVYSLSNGQVHRDKDTYEKYRDNMGSLIRHLSMRKVVTDTNPKWSIKEEKKSCIDDIVKKLKPNIQKNRSITNSYLLSNINNTFNDMVDNDTIKLVEDIVNECLSISRADDYNQWMELGWALRNIDKRLLNVWIEFSKNSAKFNRGECEDKWNRMTEHDMGLGSLIWWAKEDNNQKYIEVFNNSLIPYIDICIVGNGTDFDMAQLISKMYNNEYLCIRKEEWYRYSKDEHRWKEMNEALELTRKISEEVFMKFRDRERQLAERALHTSGEEKERLEDKIKKAGVVGSKCKSHSFKMNVIKECKSFFHREKFDELKDSKPHLIGFKNGVYDLKVGVEYKDEPYDHGFRDGHPADCITMTTGCMYAPWDPEDPISLEIMDFLKKVIPRKPVRKYLLEQLALMIDGSFKQEKFFIFSGVKGSGSNGKSTLVNLIELALGDYAGPLPISYITQNRAASNAASPELFKTIGKRFVILQEPKDTDVINVGIMKEISGNDTMATRGLFKETIYFKPQFTCFLTCNYLPQVTSDDEGTWRRIRNIEFISKFKENPNPNAKYEYSIDRNLSSKIETWKDKFISLLIHTRKHIDVDNLYEPPQVTEATKKYELDNDIVGQFIKEMIVDTDDTKTKLCIRTLYSSFKEFYQEQKNMKTKMDLASFKVKIERNPKFGPYPRSGWKGFAIRQADDEDENESDDEMSDMDD